MATCTGRLKVFQNIILSTDWSEFYEISVFSAGIIGG